MARATDALLEPPVPAKGPSATLVMSTGVIGARLPIARVVDALAKPPLLGSDFRAWERAAQAFMTTDTFPKLRARTFSIGGRRYRLAGIDKGAGMIHPNMAPHATLLGAIVTDAPVTPASLRAALAYAVDRFFNSISVDGDMSTNDTVIALANGAAYPHDDPPVEIDMEKDPKTYGIFREELANFAIELAQLVVLDGEGATKFVTVTVEVGPLRCDFHYRRLTHVSGSAYVRRRSQGRIAYFDFCPCENGFIRRGRKVSTIPIRKPAPIYQASRSVGGASLLQLDLCHSRNR